MRIRVEINRANFMYTLPRACSKRNISAILYKTLKATLRAICELLANM